MPKRTGKPRPGKPGISIEKLMKRDKGVCWICGNKVSRANASRDHVQEVSQGGVNAAWNIKLSHMHCNNKRSNGKKQLALAYSTQSEGWDSPCALEDGVLN